MIVQTLTFEGPFSQTLVVDYQLYERRRLTPTIIRVVRFQKDTFEDITDALKPDELRWLTGYVLELAS